MAKVLGINRRSSIYVSLSLKNKRVNIDIDFWLELNKIDVSNEDGYGMTISEKLSKITYPKLYTTVVDSAARYLDIDYDDALVELDNTSLYDDLLRILIESKLIR